MHGRKECSNPIETWPRHLAHHLGRCDVAGPGGGGGFGLPVGGGAWDPLLIGALGAPAARDSTHLTQCRLRSGWRPTDHQKSGNKGANPKGLRGGLGTSVYSCCWAGGGGGAPTPRGYMS